MIVADSRPIIVFCRIRRLGLLHDVAGVLMIPEAVYEELVGRGHNRPGAAEVAQGIWIHRKTVNDAAAVAHLPRLLHAGEREAIILATELNAQLFIDETRGRELAIARGLEVLGSLRILGEAKRDGLIPARATHHRRAPRCWILDRRGGHSCLSSRDGRRAADACTASGVCVATITPAGWAAGYGHGPATAGGGDERPDYPGWL